MRVSIGRINGVDANTPGRTLQRGTAHQPNHGVLTGGVRRETHGTTDASRRGGNQMLPPPRARIAGIADLSPSQTPRTLTAIT